MTENNSAEDFIKKGELLCQQGLHREAEEQFVKAIQLDPLRSYAYAFLGLAYWRQGKISEAVTCFTRALNFPGCDQEAMDATGSFLRESGRIPVTEALYQIYTKAVLEHPKPPSKRILAVYDLATQPYSVGDIIAFQGGSLAVAARHSVETIDLCFVSDPDRPPLDPAFAKMTGSSNRLFNLFTLLPVIQFNPAIGSLFVFDSYKSLMQFVSQKQDEYLLWPTKEQLDRNEYTYYEIIQLLAAHHRREKRLPQLKIPAPLAEWVTSLCQKQVFPALPVTINLRNNPFFHPERNSNINAWLEFFNYCHGRYPVKFIIICSLSEVPPELQYCPNVIIAKLQHTNLEHDMALIMAAAFHLGASSGPATIPLMGDRPYSIFNCGSIISSLHLYGESMVRESSAVARFSFANDLQRLILEPESLEILVAEFERIWQCRDWLEWRSKAYVHIGNGEESASLSWLR